MRLGMSKSARCHAMDSGAEQCSGQAVSESWFRWSAALDAVSKVHPALRQAAELACDNVPQLPGPVVIGLDVSGSMSSPITGFRGAGATSRMRCVDVAALFAAAIVRRNPGSLIVPFDTRTFEVTVAPG